MRNFGGNEAITCIVGVMRKESKRQRISTALSFTFAVQAPEGKAPNACHTDSIKSSSGEFVLIIHAYIHALLTFPKGAFQRQYSNYHAD